MAIRINFNTASQLAKLNLQRNSARLEKVLSQMSSGEKITKAGDDASGLAISQILRSQVAGLDKAARNIGDSQSVIDTAESAMGSMETILQRVRELAVQASNDTNSNENRISMQTEVDQLVEELNRLTHSVQFNRRPLLDGTFINQRLQVGLGESDFLPLSIADLRASALGQMAVVTGLGGVSVAPVAGGGDLTINGIEVPVSVGDGVSFAAADASAIAKANAINRLAGRTGVTAVAEPSVYTTAGASVGSVNLDGTTNALFINGVNIGPVTVSAGDSSGALVAAVNQVSHQTGVTASLSQTGELVLTAEDGRNFQVTTTGSVADELGLATTDGDLTAQIATGRVRLSSAAQITVGGSDPGLIGFTAGQAVTLPDLTSTVADINVSTREDAQDAIDIVDAALRQLSRARSDLGAVSNRLEDSLAQVQSQSENLQSSDSRLRDTDFAEASAIAAREQIIQQAATAILAQANMIPQMALQLLQQ